MAGVTIAFTCSCLEHFSCRHPTGSVCLPGGGGKEVGSEMAADGWIVPEIY
jgi:hypothetical protein